MTANDILALITRTGQLHMSTMSNWTPQDYDELHTLLRGRLIRPVRHCGALAGYRLMRKSNRERKRNKAQVRSCDNCGWYVEDTTECLSPHDYPTSPCGVTKRHWKPREDHNGR